MKILFRNFTVLNFLFILFSCGTTKKAASTYIDQDKPALIPKIFAADFISLKDQSEFGSVFSKDGSEFYYAVNTDGRSEIRYSQIKKKSWTEPIVLFSDEKYSFNDPCLSPDEDELFYISSMPRNELDTIEDIDIWYSKKVNGTWSSPINAGDKINSNKNEYYISFSNTGTMYFASNKNSSERRNHDFDIFSAIREEGIFAEPIKLSNAINTKRYEADVYVAPDESYLIFSSARKEGLGKGDLYISFKDSNGEWLPAKHMGNSINSNHHELCPFVTYDGKYFMYTSFQNIHWVSTKIFEQFK